MKARNMTLITLLCSAAVPALALAAEDAKTPMTEKPAVISKDARMAQQKQTKDQLEQTLGTGKDKAHYRQTLEKLGYGITAVNADDPDYLEYEVIKGGDSYEVQVDFKNGVSTEVDVTMNIWKAEATKQALKSKDYRYTYPTAITQNAKEVSDRLRGALLDEETATVETQLGIGHDRGYYRTALEKMGYKVTSVNDSGADNLELEVVKGDTSYEVKVEFDEKTRKSTSVDVSTNLWESDATDRAKGEK